MKYIYKDTGHGFNAIKSFNTMSDIYSDAFVSSLSDNENIHYSCHHIKEGTDANARTFEHGDLMFWDLDHYTDHEKALEAIAELTLVDKKFWTVVKSGNGIHLILEVNNYKEDYLVACKPAYKLLASKLKDKLNNESLIVDNVFNKSKTLRLPGTMNVKESGTTICQLLTPGLKSEFNLLKWFNSQFNTPEIQKAPLQEPSVLSLNESESEQRAFYEHAPLKMLPAVQKVNKKISSSLDLSLNECLFIKANHETPEIYSRYEWQLACSILFSHGEEGLKAAHVMSQLDSRYKASEIDAMYSDFQTKNFKPPTCETVHNATANSGNSKCFECPMRGKCHTPATIPPLGLTTFATGFYIMRTTKEGNQVLDKPNYSELVRYASMKHNLIYVSDHAEFYIFNSSFYEQIAEEKVGQIIASYLNPSPVSPTEARRSIDMAKLDLVKNSRCHSLPTTLIPLKNGLLDLNTMQILEHNPEYFYTSVMPVEYDPEAKCPIFCWWIEDRLEDLELYNAVLDYMTYSLAGVGYSNRSVMILLSEHGGTGKTMLLEILLNLFGEQATWINQNILESRFGGAAMAGKRVALIDELSATRADSMIESLKTLTGSNVISVEKKGKDQYNTENYCRFVIACNAIPNAKNKTSAFDDRLLIIPFKKTIENKDQSFRTRIFQESSGILNLLLSRVPSMKAKHFFIDPPKKTVEAVDEYKDADNQLVDFIEDTYDLCPVHDDLEKPFVTYKDAIEILKTGLYSIELKESFEHYVNWAEKERIEYIYSGIKYKKELKRILSDKRRKAKIIEVRSQDKRFNYLVGYKKRKH